MTLIPSPSPPQAAGAREVMLRSATHASLRSASDADLAACASGPCQLIIRVARPVPPELARTLRAFPGVLDCSYLPHDSFAIVASQVLYPKP